MSSDSTSRYGATAADIAALVGDLGEPAYRARQVHEGLWDRRTPLEVITNLPRSLRERLADSFPLALDAIAVVTSSDRMTTKWLWSAASGAQVETVLMRSAKRTSVCVSSQAGCAMGCTFCATGQAGFERHLDSGEILEQVVRAQHATDRRISHIVYMGMGEPLANYEAVWESVERAHSCLGISARHITISTVGVVPGMHQLAREQLPVTLAVSLHAPDDDLRAELVPLNRRYPIRDVLDAAAEVAQARGRRVTFEYAAIDTFNDEPAHADALARLLNGFPGRGGAHVNLIPLNPTGGFRGRASSAARLARFRDTLRSRGVNATIRTNRGTDIDAACGQLRERRDAG